MIRFKTLTSLLLGSAAAAMIAAPALAGNFNIPGGDLKSALDGFAAQTGVALIYPAREVAGVRTRGAMGELAADAALEHILSGTGFTMRRHPSGAIAIVRDDEKPAGSPRSENISPDASPIRVAAAASGVETVIVTSSKIKGDIQTVPIAITALSQEQLTSRQIAGGPDLVKEVPNLTFSKTNFTGYNIQIRGIGTQAISVTTDPAVAVALNDIPFIRNHFFEQEFFDVNQVEVLRGPQGTLYGRNATAGVVNVISAKPTDQFEAMLSADWGNYSNRRYEGMVNIPIVDDRLDLRVAGEWTKRDGYSTNQITGSPIDGRDLWSSRVSLGWKPAENVQVNVVWEHFSESDDRLRSGKQLCKTAPTPDYVDGASVYNALGTGQINNAYYYLSQGCQAVSLYSPEAFEVPNGLSLVYASAIGFQDPAIRQSFDPYASTVQSHNLRVIESTINPTYRAKNDTLELNVDYNVTQALTFTSQTGYNNDFLWSAEDYNRFDTAPGFFVYGNLDSMTAGEQWDTNTILPDPGGPTICDPNTGQCLPSGIFCDPQLGCADRLVAEDLSNEHSWQLSHEFRLASNFSGPFNFSIGGNYLHYETEENYYVFINSLTHRATTAPSNLTGGPALQRVWQDPVTGAFNDNSQCVPGGLANANPTHYHDGYAGGCSYIDPNPIGSLNNEGHNYFLSQNPYVLNSYAGFGEVYYKVTPELKLTAGLRWTDDQKHFTTIPSQIAISGYGYGITGVVDQKWNKWTGRFATDWTPKLDFTDQTLVYGSFARGYKAGGANPPGAGFVTFAPSDLTHPTHPLTFKPEFIDAYELGSKNTLLDGGLTLDGDVFFYNYTGYQISKIVDRTAINDNFNATVKGAEVEAMYEPVPGLKFNFAGGYEDTRIKNGQASVDLMDRTAGNPDWMVVKPFVTQASNCILPIYVVRDMLRETSNFYYAVNVSCGQAYNLNNDPITGNPYNSSTNVALNGGYHYYGFDPLAGTVGDPYTGQNIDPVNGIDYGPAPNNGEGFAKNIGGNQLPNAPHFTVSLSGDYTIPVSEDWAATLHSDFYWQSQSFARVYNDRPYDKIRGYSTTNVALILTSASGWQVMAYLKNVFDATAITGDFLNSDDSGLTTNIFLTDPRLFGVRVTKNW